MTLPEHLDPETTAPDLPDGYDPDGGWEPIEWLDFGRCESCNGPHSDCGDA